MRTIALRSLAIVTITFCMTVLLASGIHAAERIVGLVEIPAFYGGDRDEILKHPKASVKLFDEPSGTASVVAAVHDFTQLETYEHESEKASAVCYEYRVIGDNARWFKVRYRVNPNNEYSWLDRLNDKHEYSFAWLKGADAGELHWYSKLVHSHNSFLTKSWDKRLYQHPNRSSTFTLYDKLGGRLGVDVLVALTANWGKHGQDHQWFLVVIVEGDRYDYENLTIIATGWVPAYADDGSETVWFYSRD